jgi:uncharacterized protein (TIGR03067 family)
MWNSRIVFVMAQIWDQVTLMSSRIPTGERVMARVFALVLVAFFTATIDGRSDVQTEDSKQDPDLKLLQGTWRIAYHETRGEEDTQETIWELNVKGENYTLSADGTTTRGTIKLDSSRKPKQLEYTVEDDETTTFIGIYELMGDTYKTCDVEKDKDPLPTEFKTKARTGQIAVWKKVKVKD